MRQMNYINLNMKDLLQYNIYISRTYDDGSNKLYHLTIIHYFNSIKLYNYYHYDKNMNTLNYSPFLLRGDEVGFMTSN